MDKVKAFFKGRVGGIVLCVLEIIVGVLLLINPVGFANGIIIGAGWLLALAGAFCIVRYFLVKPETGAASQLLFRGLTMLLVGVLCITKYAWLLTVFPLTLIYAAWLLVLGMMKIQQMADMLRLKKGRWYMPAIAAGLALAIAVVILVDPFGVLNAALTFVGISLIAEAVVELVGAILK